MPEPSVPGRTIVTRRALLDVIRGAVLGSYGVTGFADRDRLRRLFRMVGLPPRGIDLALDGGIGIDVYITVAHGLPVAEVGRQVDSAVRHALRRATGREVARLVVHVNGLRVLPAAVPPATAGPIGRAGPAHQRADDEAARGDAADAGQAPLAFEPSRRIRAALRRTARADGGRR